MNAQSFAMEPIAPEVLGRTEVVHPAIAHFKMLFEPTDLLCLTFINRGTGAADNKFISAELASTPRCIERLKAKNDLGNDIYVAMNHLLPGADQRIKELVGTPRNVFMDLDHNGDEVLAAVRASVAAGEIPEPSVILCSSPGKYQFVWRVDPNEFSTPKVEAVNEALVQRFGGDPACTDVLRVLRIPGFRNLKYPERPIVEVISSTPGRLYAYDDFKLAIEAAKEHVVRPVAADDELSKIIDYFEKNADKAKVPISELKRWGNNGYLWQLTCPWCISDHTGQKDSGTVVILHTSGALDFVCQHGHCKKRRWGAFREKLELIVGEQLPFGDSVGNVVINTDRAALTTTSFVEERPEHRKVDAGAVMAPAIPTVAIALPVVSVVTAEVGEVGAVEASGVRVIECEEVPVSDPLTMPESAMTSTVLGDIYSKIFAPNGFPMGIALPALVTAASVRVPQLFPTPAWNEDGQVVPSQQKDVAIAIPGDDSMVNLYCALIAEFGGGKSQAAEWGCKALGIYQQDRGPHYLEGKFGSAEMMLRYIKRNLSGLKENFLVNPDEWSFLFAKSNIPNASLPTFLTTSYYRRRQTFEIGNRTGEVLLNHAISFIGGVVEKDFDSVFGAATLGGLYDRFLFGWADGWMWSFRPYPFELPGSVRAWAPVAVQYDPSVFEVVASWNKKNRGVGRVVEICVRIATIFASMDGRRILYGQDLEKLSGLAANQIALRTKFCPNQGLNPDAQFSNATENWLAAHTHGEWVSISDLKTGVHGYEMKLGPNVAERALAGLARGDRVDIWLPKVDREGRDTVPLPTEWKGRRPRLGLVRRKPL